MFNVTICHAKIRADVIILESVNFDDYRINARRLQLIDEALKFWSLADGIHTGMMLVATNIEEHHGPYFALLQTVLFAIS